MHSPVAKLIVPTLERGNDQSLSRSAGFQPASGRDARAPWRALLLLPLRLDSRLQAVRV